MNQFISLASKAKSSRTFWTLVLMVLLATIPELKELIPAPYYNAAMAGLGALAAYFKLNPSQEYGR